jgi:hypothetical protein
MKKLLHIRMAAILIACIVTTFAGLRAQQAVMATGGSVSGTGGSVSYSVGQVAYNPIANSYGFADQGVQHAYEIYTSGIDLVKYLEEIRFAPNPVISNAILSIVNRSLEGLSYKIIDSKGRLVVTNKIASSITSIDASAFPPAVYLLCVLSENTRIKTFVFVKK